MAEIELTDKQQMAVVTGVNHVKTYMAMKQLGYSRKDLEPFRFLFINGFAGTGKALANDQIVQTPEGIKKMGDIKIGDKVFGKNGTSTEVTGVYPQGKRQSYRITFRDGASVECDEDHLWTVWTQKQRRKGQPPQTLPLKEIIKKGIKFDSGPNKFYIPLCDPVQYEEKILPIHPYLMGVMLGDGSLCGQNISISCPDKDRDIIEKIKPLLMEGVFLNKNTCPPCPYYSLTDPLNYRNRIKSIVSELNLNVKSREKFIPEIYKRSSVDQRYSLLRGLMDTDGSGQNNRITFSTKSEYLAEDIADLARSLGGTALINYQKREGEISVNIKTFENPFSLERKAGQWNLSWKNPPSRAITKVEKTSIKEHTCIKVDNDDGLFLTNDYIVTHNTTVIKEIWNRLGKAPSLIDNNEKYVKSPIGTATSFTGRACQNLINRDVPCYTSHSLFYEAVLDEKGNLKYFQMLDDNKIKDNIGDFLMIEEVSMFPDSLIDTIVSKTDCPILLIGDDEQLPPIEGESVYEKLFKEKQFEFSKFMILEDIMRTKDDSSIDIFANHLRETGSYAFKMVNNRDLFTESKKNLTVNWFKKNWKNWDVVVCGKNKTRKKFNNIIRIANGFTSEIPDVGERIMCVQNTVINDEKLNNGELFEVVAVYPGEELSNYMIQKVDADGKKMNGKTLTVTVENEYWIEEQPSDKYASDRSVQRFVFGYAITAHKMQGSSAPSVIFYDEDVSFFLDQKAYRYTACTRASSKLMVVR